MACSQILHSQIQNWQWQTHQAQEDLQQEEVLPSTFCILQVPQTGN